jgi:hypothetical protein
MFGHPEIILKEIRQECPSIFVIGSMIAFSLR